MNEYQLICNNIYLLNNHDIMNEVENKNNIVYLIKKNECSNLI